MYSILVAKIKKILRPTSDLFNPVENCFIYESECEIKSFETEYKAFEFVQQYLPLTEYICIPGHDKGLQLYWDLWGGIDEDVLQDVDKLSKKLMCISNYNFDYMQDDYDDLKCAMESLEQIENPPEPEERIHEGKMNFDGYIYDKSRLIGDRFSMLMSRNTDIDFDDLTLEEQKQCVVYSDKNVWVNCGYLFDLYCIKTHPEYYRLYAWYVYLTCNAGYTYRKVLRKTQEFVVGCIYRINKIRIKNNWY